MKTQLVDGVELHRSSGNVFANLGLTQQEVAKRMGISLADWMARLGMVGHVEGEA